MRSTKVGAVVAYSWLLLDSRSRVELDCEPRYECSGGSGGGASIGVATLFRL
jgi:hypothetical protein